MQDVKSLNDFISPVGFICHKKFIEGRLWWDCGDASQRQFMAIYFWHELGLKNRHFLVNLWDESFAATWKELNPIRCPAINQPPMGEESEWWAETRNYTLDQMRPLICSAICLKHTSQVSFLFSHMKARHGFAWNFRKIGQKADDASEKIPDVMGSIEWTLFRAYLAKHCSQKLNWYDRARLSVDTALIKAKAEFRILWSMVNPKETGDDLNFFLMLRTLARLNYSPSTYVRYMRASKVRDWVGDAYKINGVVSAFADYFWNSAEHPPFQDYALSLYEQDLAFIEGRVSFEQWVQSTT